LVLSDEGVLYGALLKDRVILEAERGEVAPPNTARVEGDEAGGLVEAEGRPVPYKEPLWVASIALLTSSLAAHEVGGRRVEALLISLIPRVIIGASLGGSPLHALVDLTTRDKAHPRQPREVMEPLRGLPFVCGETLAAWVKAGEGGDAIGRP
jgi:hypothetical protein